jgi:SPX domain protein involved in polyphosphate accumulation
LICRKLDALQNYRVYLTQFARRTGIDDIVQTLNLIGFQKVLKKWEKVTHMAIQDAYLKEKVTTMVLLS